MLSAMITVFKCKYIIERTINEGKRRPKSVLRWLARRGNCSMHKTYICVYINSETKSLFQRVYCKNTLFCAIKGIQEVSVW